MKIKLCFSGFSPGEIALFQAETDKLYSSWDCRFVPEVATARDVLSAPGCAALVVNLSGLGAAGVALLQDAGQRFPDTLRFILGNVEDQALTINRIGGSHQFIRQPCGPAELIKNIQRGLKLDAWLSTSEIRALAPRLSRLPSLPSTYFSLIREIESPSATLDSIAAIIVRDPVATARLLQTANSAVFSPAEKVANPADAVALLGVQTVKSLVLCLQIFGQKDEARESGVNLEIIWEHSLKVAKFARLITLNQTADHRLAEEAFTIGLLHDVGRIVMATNMPREYSATVSDARKNARALSEAEADHFGANHARVGAYLLGLWGLPAHYIEATAAHHSPGQTAFAPEFCLLSAVHAANVFAHEMGGQTDGLPLPQLDQAYYHALKLDNQLAQWRQICTGETVPHSSPASPSPNLGPPPQPSALSAVRPPAPIPFGFKPVLAAAIILVALLVWRLWAVHHASREIQPPAAPPQRIVVTPAPPLPPPKAPPNPIPEVTTKEPRSALPPAKASPLDQVRVQGIVYRSANPVVIIDNNSFSVGDSFNSIKVIAISQSAVTLSFNGRQKVYPIK